LIGMLVSTISPKISMREGKSFVTCKHKDGSYFFVSVDIQSFLLDNNECYRGIIHRTQPNKVSRQRSKIQYDEIILSGDVLGWYEITKDVLGSGFFGAVRIATHRLTGISVAIKTLNKKQYVDCGMQYPPREMELMMKLHHPNIFRFFHSIETDEASYMITEIVPGGELFDYAAQRERLPENECRGLMRQILSGVDYMHRCGICHRDLKLENILLDAFGCIKIIDFGLGNFFDISGSAKKRSFCGSPDYAAPELWESKPYSGPEVDVWSMGVILFILVTGFIPFNRSAHVVEIQYQWPKLLGVVYSVELLDLVDRIFRPAHARCRVEDMIVHPWVNDSGDLNVIVRHALEKPRETLNELILVETERLGLPRGAVELAVLAKEHNQLCTTYALLEFQAEENVRLRSRSGTSSGHQMTPGSPKHTGGDESPSETLSGSPLSGSFRESLRDSLRESQKRCTIS
jgi:5'-AMP-activated protein kinase catalytic alpha subunit